MFGLTKAHKGRTVTLVLIAVGILLLTGGPTLAQLAPPSDPSSETFSPGRGMKPAGAYAIGDIETINMVNGNLALNIPLAALPPGRGGLSGSLNLFYNSKIWDIRSVMSRAARSDGTPDSRRYNLIPSPDGSWKYGFKFELRVENRDYAFITDFTSASNYDPCKDVNAIYYFKLFVVFPDGSQHEFRLRDQNDWEGYFAYRPDGSTTNQCQTIQPLTGTMVYYSMDGTYMRLEVQHDSDSTTSNNPWTLYLPDGSRVTGGSAPQRVYDRNGNYIETQEHITFNAHDAVQIADQLGRRIVLEYGSAPDEDAVHAWGIGGTEIVTRIKWKTISILRSYDNGQGIVPLLARFKSVIDQIVLPIQSGGIAYTFGYNAPDYNFSAPSNNPPLGWGELNLVTLPTGAQSAYSYKLDGLTTIDPEVVLTNSINSKRLTYQQEYDGSSTPVTDAWTYAFDPDFDLAQMTGPDGGTTKVFHYAVSGLTGVWFQNLTYKTERPDGSVSENLWNRNTPFGHPTSFYADNPYVKTEFVSIPNATGTLTQTAIKDYTYDKNGNVTQVAEYDWVQYASVPRDAAGRPTGVPAGIQPKRITRSKFAVETPDATDATTSDPDSYHYITAPHLLRAIASSEIGDSAKTIARSEFGYDDPLTTGNLIKKTSWDSTKGSYSNPLISSNSISVQTQYNSYGSPILMTDAVGNQTQLVYGNIAGFTDLYPTQVKTAFGTAVQRTQNRDYDFYLGQVTSITDVDNQLVSSATYDVFGRPLQIRAGQDMKDVLVGTGFSPDETLTVTEYSDIDRRVIVRSDLNTRGDGKLVSIQHYDQLGRVRLTRQLEDASTQSATDEAQGIKVQTRYVFNATNSFMLTSNPYRAATSGAATNEVTMGWTRTEGDNVGRQIETQTFGGAALPAPWGTNSNSTGTVTTAYDADRTLVSDQAGKKRINRTDGLGRLKDIWEITAADSATEAVAFPGFSSIVAGYRTSYSYDALDHLLSVNQGVQTRTFIYSSLSRLTSAGNPESGTVNYDYFDNGNLRTKFDARLLQNTSTRVSTSYTYDALNRPLARSYNDGTPTVTYTYDDANVLNSKGRLTRVSSSASTYAYGQFDALGRVKTGTQTTDGQSYLMSYQYNLAGHLVSQIYPSGRIVKTEYDRAGRIAGVKNNTTGTYYAGAASADAANRLQYSATGGVQAMKLGNGLWEHTNFNARLQRTQIGLGSASTNSSILQLDYSYGTNDNNSNLRSQTITVPTIGTVNGLTTIQTYTYDALNRLGGAKENNGNSWQQNFDYDRYSNRKFISGTSLPSALTTANNPIISPANNRIDNSVSGQTNVLYDNAGNLTREQSGRTYQYDGENRLMSVDGGATTSGGASYSYDGDGRRVKKVVGGATLTTNIFVYDLSGQLVAEYSTVGSTATGTSYITSDTLGSPRVITGSNQQVKGRHDYLPFGEELTAVTGGRTTPQGYSASDGVRQQFTDKERDNETGLDFFGARFYSSVQGRFTTPDPLQASARSLQPQSWNRYTYVLNRPLCLIDPNGLDWGISIWFDKEENRWVTQYHYFTGDIGDWNGHSYTAVNFGGDATRTLDLSDGRTVAISNNPDALGGAYMRDVTAHPQAEQEPTLAPSWLDRVPIAHESRQFLFHYSTQNFEAAMGDFALLAVNLGTIAASAPASGASTAANLVETEATQIAKEGIYEFTAASGRTYVGQSGNIGQRLLQHIASGKLLPEDLATVRTTEVLGGKTMREIAEQLRINALGGVKNLENIRNPIGIARQYLLTPH